MLTDLTAKSLASLFVLRNACSYIISDVDRWSLDKFKTYSKPLWRCLVQGADAPPSTVKMQFHHYLEYCRMGTFDREPLYMFEHEIPNELLSTLTPLELLSHDVLEELQTMASKLKMENAESVLAERQWVIFGSSKTTYIKGKVSIED